MPAARSVSGRSTTARADDSPQGRDDHRGPLDHAHRVVRETVALGSTVVLAHLVTPSAFGRAAVALALLPLATILTFEGFASVLVQKPTLDDAHVRTASLLSLLSGLLLSAVAFVLARPVGGAIFGSDTGALLQMASPVFLLAAVGSVPRALLWRRLDFRMIGVATSPGSWRTPSSPWRSRSPASADAR